ncbi:MAG: amino acid transporter, partial [Nakamurella sp.]
MPDFTAGGGRQVGLWGVVAIGVGGMVGGGIFAVLGLSVQLTAGAAPLAFLLAGLVALLTARSYALLSKSFPSRGGTVTFVNRAFGSGLFSGGINILLWL